MSALILIYNIILFMNFSKKKACFSVTVFLRKGERVSGKGADLYEMCDELDAMLRGL